MIEECRVGTPARKWELSFLKILFLINNVKPV